MLMVMLKTQVFSASALGVAVAAAIPRIFDWCPRALASGNEQYVPVRRHGSDSFLSPLLGRSRASPIHARVPLVYFQMR
jgi:hypothetical protein